MIQTAIPDVVPFVDLESVNGAVFEQLRNAFERVLTSSKFIGGPEVERFEELLAARVGTRYAVGVSSGTAALQLALEAAGIGAGDEVVLPPNTFFATAEAVVAAGALPVFADVDPDSALIDPEAVRAAIGPRTAAVIAVHLYGQTVDMDALGQLTADKGLLLLEDAAQAIGAAWADRPAGSLGRAAAFSFYPSKNLGALGDAGAVTTSDTELARKVAMLRNHGQEAKYVHAVTGYNHRMDELQAAFLAVKLRYLAEVQAQRDRAAARYRELLTRLDDVKLLWISPKARHVHHLMVIRVGHRDEMVAALRATGIDASVHYPCPIHLEPAWRLRGGSPGQFPRAEALAQSILSLPLFPGISDQQVDRCVDAVASLRKEKDSMGALASDHRVLGTITG